jgi:hypothetical protein
LFNLKMTFVSNFPSMLIFGPHVKLPPAETLEELRQDINTIPRLSALKHAVGDLPRFWNALVSFDPELSQVPGASRLGQLSQWLRVGGHLPHAQSDAPNYYGLAVTILLQISQYSRYLDYLGSDAHLRILKSVQAGGIQGFCAGFLSTLAVASAGEDTDLGSTAAVALRLAVCIGAYVDRDGIYSEQPEIYSTIAIRWKEGNPDGKSEVTKMIQSFPKVSRALSPITHYS